MDKFGDEFVDWSSNDVDGNLSFTWGDCVVEFWKRALVIRFRGQFTVVPYALVSNVMAESSRLRIHLRSRKGWCEIIEPGIPFCVAPWSAEDKRIREAALFIARAVAERVRIEEVVEE